jgi:restriction endonuclease Mrr
VPDAEPERSVAATINARLILIDGDRLARLMIQYGVG